MTVRIDSDILIEVSRGRDKAVVERWIERGRSDALEDVFGVLNCVASD